MTDLVEQLRDDNSLLYNCMALRNQAADEIERLREALSLIADHPQRYGNLQAQIAAEALKVSDD